MQRIAIDGLEPDCTVILDLPAGSGAPDRFEREELQTHEKRREAYLEIAAADPDRCRVVNADRSEEEIAADILALVEPLVDELSARPAAGVETVE